MRAHQRLRLDAQPRLRLALTCLALATLPASLAAGAALDARPVSEADVAAHKGRMAQAEDLRLDLFDAVDTQEMETLRRAAARLRPLLDAEHDYWLRTGLTDAIALSDRNRAALGNLQKASADGSPEAISQAVLDLSASCSACHDAHPEKRVRTGRPWG